MVTNPLAGTSPATESDCIVVGASFAGLACATALARSGMDVVVLEKKSDPGEGLHTTGIIVKDAIDQVALLDHLPAATYRRIDGVRLYSPNLKYVDLSAPGYYFLATDTPEVMRWLAAAAEREGARIDYNQPFKGATRTQSGFELADGRRTRYLVGADGPSSQVGKSFGLGVNMKFLAGMEYEYRGVEIEASDRLHCFISRSLAPGYIAWVVPGVGMLQVGLARRSAARPVRDPDNIAGNIAGNIKVAMNAFVGEISPLFDIALDQPDGVRAGLIPCGGVVDPVATTRALLVGDAAGMVSPVTAGGIHTALSHGSAAGHAIAGYLQGAHEDPAGWFVESYPRFRGKRVLRFLYDHFQSDWMFNLLLATAPMRMAAGMIYFHRRGVFEP